MGCQVRKTYDELPLMPECAMENTAGKPAVFAAGN